jgi:hypothetical protein
MKEQGVAAMETGLIICDIDDSVKLLFFTLLEVQKI